MKCKLTRDELRDALARVVKVCAKSDNIPVLGHILMTASNSGGVNALEIVGSNIEMIITAVISEVDVKREGAVLLPASHVWSVVSALSGDLELAALANNRTRLKTKSSTVHVAGLPATDYITVTPLPDTDMHIAGSDILGLIQKTLYAVSKDDSRGTFCGALLKSGDDGLEMVATDGHCLAMATLHDGGDPPQWLARGVVIPRNALIEIQRSISKDAAVQLGFSNNRVSVMQRGTCITASVVEGRFPDFSQVIQRGDNTVTLRALELKRAVKVAMTANETAVSVASGSDSIKVSSVLDTSDAEAHVTTTDSAGAFKFLADGHKLSAPCALMSESMRVTVSDATSPVIVEDPADDSHVHIIMPRKL